MKILTFTKTACFSSENSHRFALLGLTLSIASDVQNIFRIGSMYMVKDPDSDAGVLGEGGRTFFIVNVL